jgi:hypothetical protein
MSTQTEFTWPADSARPVIITKGITGKENAESQTSSDVMSMPAAVGRKLISTVPEGSSFLAAIENFQS